MTDCEDPRVNISSIEFNDGTVLNFKRGSVVVFTGANNSGKSQVLKDVESSFDSARKALSVVVKDLHYDFVGNLEESFFEQYFSINQSGYLELPGDSGYYTEDSIRREWDNGELPHCLRRLFVRRISTEMRLAVSNSLKRSASNASAHPMCKVMRDERVASKISHYFRLAFGEDLVVNRNELNTISLYVGEAPDKASFTIEMQDDYYSLVESLPKLQDQGDGMRSFASILLDAFTSEQSVSLIDEPEAFLHPPQARILGKMLASGDSNDRQLVVSTHSEDFLKGLLDADNDDVVIVRINRVDNTNNMSVLDNGQIRELWANPLLRYSNILSGLFHEMVVVCESDYDCLFYQALIDAIYEAEEKVAPDILFTHCGGKARLKDVVRALKAVDVPVAAISDFDLLNSSQVFRPLIESFGVSWDVVQSTGMKTVYDSMNGRQRAGIDAWAAIKDVGKIGLGGEAPAAYEKVESLCRATGLFVVPCGEMESFDKTISAKKKDWVYAILESYDLAHEPKLEAARSFVRSVVEYGLSAGVRS